MQLAERFWSKVDKNGPIPEHVPHLGNCWVWTASLVHRGYGAFALTHQKTVPAHRAAFFLHHGRWPEPCALHRCDNRACVRMDHLFEGTKGDNARDAIQKQRFPFHLENLTAPAMQRAKTHCPQGHEYTLDNLVARPSGHRDCKTCHRDRMRLRKQKLKEAA
jgi:hypothetical protein